MANSRVWRLRQNFWNVSYLSRRLGIGFPNLAVACGVLYEIATTHATKILRLCILKLPILLCMNRVDANLWWPALQHAGPAGTLEVMAFSDENGNSA